MGVKRSRQLSVSSSEDPRSPVSTTASVNVKIVHLDADSAVSEQAAVMRCSLPPHEPLSFASFEEYDVHHQKTHMNRCSECHKNFPDEHFLSLHISENHDPIRAAKQAQGEKTFACLIPTCDRLCSAPHKRRLHCIDKHSFPRDYDFFIVNDGIDRRNSMLRPPHRRRSSTVNSTNSTGLARRRGPSMSGVSGEGMDLVKDEDGGGGEEEDEVEGRRVPVKLRGRGGFGHPRGSGRGRGHVRRSSRGGTLGSAAQTSTVSPTSQSKTTASADPMEGLTSSMSTLQFVPHSLYARGRGKGRGGT